MGLFDSLFSSKTKQVSQNPKWVDDAGQDLFKFAQNTFFGAPSDDDYYARALSPWGYSSPASTTAPKPSQEYSPKKQEPYNRATSPYKSLVSLGFMSDDDARSLSYSSPPSGFSASSDTGGEDGDRDISLQNLRALPMYQGSRVAGLSPTQQNAQHIANASVGISDPFFEGAFSGINKGMDVAGGGYNSAMKAFSDAGGYVPRSTEGYSSPFQRFPDAAHAYMNPFVGGALDVAARKQREGYEQDVLSRQASRGARSAFGGSRLALEDSLADKNYMQSVGDLYAQGLSDAYDRAAGIFASDEGRLMGQFNEERNREQQAADLLRALGDSSSNAGSRAASDLFSGANALVGAGKTRNDVVDQTFSRLLQTGNLERDIEQQGIDVDYKNFIEQRDYPKEVMNQFNQLISGNPAARAVENVDKPNSAGQAIGTAVNIASLFAGSDRRLKTEAFKVGSHNIEGAGDVNVYRYKYAGNPEYHIGVMADEVEKVMPDAVGVRGDGMKFVNYTMIGAEHLLRG